MNSLATREFITGEGFIATKRLRRLEILARRIVLTASTAVENPSTVAGPPPFLASDSLEAIAEYRLMDLSRLSDPDQSVLLPYQAIYAKIDLLSATISLENTLKRPTLSTVVYLDGVLPSVDTFVDQKQIKSDYLTPVLADRFADELEHQIDEFGIALDSYPDNE